MVLTRAVSEVWWEQRLMGVGSGKRTQLDNLLKDLLVNGAEKWMGGGGGEVFVSIFYLN